LPQRLFPEGDVPAYSNYGVALAGYIVERVLGEAYAAYVQRHIFDLLGRRHSTFHQPLPDDLAPLMAKGYRRSDKPPLAFFESIAAAPAGGLSATANADMGRFIRALINGGELDGIRISVQGAARRDDGASQRHARRISRPRVLRYESGGPRLDRSRGATMAFFSDLKFFPEQRVGIFVSRDGMG
jgi:CubicO group peptidase (beta-lactamase class C family)